MIAVSIQDLRPGPQDTSAFFLEKIYQLQADPNMSRTSNTSIVSEPPTFSPPGYAVVVNSLWFSSLLISLTTAVIAVSTQHWARQYIKATQPAQYIPHKRARVRAFVSGGYSIPRVIEILPAMVHICLLLFVAGLLRYLSHIHRTIFLVVCGCAGLLPFVRFWIVITSSRWLGRSPYTVFFSLIDLLTVAVVIHGDSTTHGDNLPTDAIPSMGVVAITIFALGYFLVCSAFFKSSSIKKRAEKASRQSKEIDTLILNSTLDGLREDDTREKFFESISGFYRSDVVKDLQQCLPKEVKSKVQFILIDFFRRTLLSDTIPGLAKFRRLAICITAADDTDTSTGSEYNFAKIIYQYWHAIPQSVEFGEFLRSWDKWRNGRYAQWIIANIVAKKDEHDDRWMALAMDYLGISQHVLQDYLAHGDSIQLAILIHSIRHAMRSNFSPFRLLPPLSRFNVLNTLPRLQHEFCDLWNTLAQNPPDREDPSASISILKAIRHIYVALHQGTDAAPTCFSASTEDVDGWLNHPLSYPLCDIPDHLPNSTPPIYHASVGEVTHRRPAATSIPPSLPVPETHSGGSTPHPADESSLRDRPARIIQSFHPACHVPPHSAPAPVDPLTTTSTQTTTHHSAISASVTHDSHSTPAVTGVGGSLQSNPDYDVVSISVPPRTPVPPSVSLPDEALPTDLQLQSTDLTVVSDHLPVELEDHPPNLPSATSPAVHQGTPILDGEISLDVTELVATNYSQDTDTPSPALTTHFPHPITSDPGITRELAYPPGIEPTHDFGRPR